ncbi:hypothetical protein NHP164001_06210 [Helicobacter trogontum]|uniref:Uncharacterized protein n=1 Tax=Helicobacter trogontum TaxID=50960 RepID=A0ABQ0D2N8_9HELI
MDNTRRKDLQKLSITTYFMIYTYQKYANFILILNTTLEYKIYIDTGLPWSASGYRSIIHNIAK